ncbi:MAG: hypothetical protein JSR36_04735 [Proteobacteria bacterium]|nr:hypothetical protein [Pseudomonadota bacterium]
MINRWFLLMVLGSWTTLAAADNALHVGQWKKNLAESINMPDPSYQETVLVRRSDSILDFTWTGVAANGKTDSFSYSGKVDGKERELPGEMSIYGTMTATADGITRSVLKYPDGSTEDKMCVLVTQDKMTCYATLTSAAGKPTLFKEVFDRVKTLR